MSLVGSTHELPVSTFHRHANRLKIVRSDDAGRPRRFKVRIAPRDGRAHGFGSIAFAVRSRSQHPPDFRHARQRWLQIPLEIGEPNFPDKISRCLLLRHPIAEAQHRPMANVAQKLRPALLFAKRLAPDVSGYVCLRPHRRAADEIVLTLPTQREPFSFEDRYFHGRKRTKHAGSVRLCVMNKRMAPQVGLEPTTLRLTVVGRRFLPSTA